MTNSTVAIDAPARFERLREERDFLRAQLAGERRNIAGWIAARDAQLARAELAERQLDEALAGCRETTTRACAALGKHFTGIEREPKYFDIACKRIDEAYRQPRLFKGAEAMRDIIGSWKAAARERAEAMTIEEAMERVRGIAAAVSCGDTCKASEALRLILDEVERLKGALQFSEQQLLGERKNIAGWIAARDANLQRAELAERQLDESLAGHRQKAEAFDAIRLLAGEGMDDPNLETTAAGYLQRISVIADRRAALGPK